MSKIIPPETLRTKRLEAVKIKNCIFADKCDLILKQRNMHYNDQGADFKYLIVNERDKRFGLSVTTVGFQAIRAGSVYPPRNHPDAYYFTAQKGRVLHEYQLVYITKGRGTFASDTTPSVDISKGQILFLFPGQWHTYAPLQKTGWNEYYIGFEGPIIDNLVKNSFISKESQILDIGINEELASLFARALEVAEADKTAAQQYLSGIVLHIMGAVLAISQNKRYEVDNAAQKIESAKIIMHENVYKDIDPEELAMKLGISYSWFRKVFKEYTGYAPAKYFQELKLRKAKQLLIESSMSVKEICYELNYTSTEHFFSVFKKRTNFTPTEYRNFGRGGKEKENENE